MTNPSENNPEQSNIMQLFQVINNPRHDDDHVTVLDLADGRFESTDPKVTILEKQSKMEPTMAPGMNHQELEEKATEEEVIEGESTSVTQLYLDRTPDK